MTKLTEATGSLSKTATGPKFGCRYVQVILLCTCLVFGYGSRSNLSVAIVAITDNTTSPNPDVPTYNWTNSSVVLSSFFWSYIILQVFAGHLGKKYGPKYILLGGSFVNYCACGAFPLAAAKFGSTGAIVCRVIQGLSQGCLTPSIQVMMGTWVPAEERTTLHSITTAGYGIGSLMATLLTGYISASWWGWTYSFYILALMGFVWCIFWVFFGHNSPETHPRISEEERRYIQRSLKQEDNVNLPTPWRKIMTCLPFYAIMIGWLGNAWCHAMAMTEIPTYFAKVMNFSIKSNALISAFPVIIGIVGNTGVGILSDWVITKKYLTTRNARRTFHSIGSVGITMGLTCFAFLRKDQAHIVIVIQMVTPVLSSFGAGGATVNHLDLSPRFAGVLFGFLNGSTQVSSILAPLIAQWVITDLTNASQWRMVFLAASGCSMLCAIIYFFCASADRQDWDGPESDLMKKRAKKISVVSLPGGLI